MKYSSISLSVYLSLYPLCEQMLTRVELSSLQLLLLLLRVVTMVIFNTTKHLQHLHKYWFVFLVSIYECIC